MTYKVYKIFKGKRYAYEYEAYYDATLKKARQRMVRYLGPCNKRGKIVTEPKIHFKGLHSAFPVGSLAIFYAVSKQLRLRENIERSLGVEPQISFALLCIVLNQVTARVPIYRLENWIKASPLPKWEKLDADEITSKNFEEVLAALCHLTPEKTWENRGLILQNELTKAWRGSSREPAGVYYDITKQQYYGSHCPYAQLGHTELGTSNVVSFGLVVSKEHHHPIFCQVFPGGQNDSLSVSTVLEMLQGQGLKRLTMIMDRGMTAKNNVDKAVDAKYDVLGLVKGWGKESIAYASQWPGEELERPENVVGTSNGGAVYARAFTAPIMGFKKMRIAVVENIIRKADERQARDLLIQELEGSVSDERLKEIRSELGDVIVTSKGRRGFLVDEKAVERERALDGRFLLFSTNLSLNGPEMYRTYFARDAIEKVFRTSKGELSLGPVRYRRKDRLDAYATVIYMSYLLWSWAQRKLQNKYPQKSLSEALHSLEGISWVRFGADKFMRQWCTKLTQEQKEILSAVGDTSYLHTT